MRRKYIKLAIVITVMAVLIGRIVYVNVTYPFAGVHNKNVGDEITVQGYTFTVSNADYYSKNEWKDYLLANNIELEEEKYKLLYGEADDNISDFDYAVSYNPTMDYTVIVVKLTFKDTAGTKEKYIANRCVSVGRQFNGDVYFYDKYYSDAVSGLGADNELISVYITNDSVSTAQMMVLEFGNNMAINLGERD
ncbi:MAG: hypothetical protein ACI4EV_06530 [Lachnospiraceae bacterium]